MTPQPPPQPDLAALTLRVQAWQVFDAALILWGGFTLFTRDPLQSIGSVFVFGFISLFWLIPSLLIGYGIIRLWRRGWMPAAYAAFWIAAWLPAIIPMILDNGITPLLITFILAAATMALTGYILLTRALAPFTPPPPTP